MVCFSNPKVPQNTVGSDHDYTCTPTTDAHKLVAAKEYIKQLEEKVEKYEIERFGLARYSTNPDDIRFFTGFTSYELLKSFFHSLAPYAARIIVWTRHKRLTSNMCSRMYDTGNSCKLQLIDQLLMFLKKIRLATLDQELAFQFCVSQSTVSRNTITWANFLYCVLGSQPLWPSREQVQRAMPSSFLNKYPAVRVILDCTELKVQSPSSLVLNSELYSHYKGTTTFKSLVGIAPSGLLTFVSSLYAGSISDKHITMVSGILDLLDSGDQVMADKGFVIQDLLEKKECMLVIPNFLARKGQFTKEETEENEKIANLRVHVERAIRRFKEFHIFDAPIPLNLAGTINQLWAVCCLLTNFQGPLILQK